MRIEACELRAAALGGNSILILDRPKLDGHVALGLLNLQSTRFRNEI